MNYSLILDVVVIVLLAVTIGYAMVLNRRLGRLRRDKADLEGLAGSFGGAIQKAAESVAVLRQTSEELQERVEKAQALRDDLAFLTERGVSAADRLEESIRTARDQAPPKGKSVARGKTAAQKAALDTDEDDELVAKSDAERELLKALQQAR